MEKIGELINHFRENKGMSQAELSEGIRKHSCRSLNEI